MENLEHYNLFAELFKYPSIKMIDGAVKCQERLKSDYPEVPETLDRFVRFALDTPLYSIEEIYLKTFHIQAICYLDLGYVMFGEDYKRGEFLVNMKREQKQAGNDCGNDLPDNLVNVLTLLPKLDDESFIRELTTYILIPSLRKMLDEFSESRIELKNKMLEKKHKAILLKNQPNGNIYQYAMKSLLMVLRSDFNYSGHEEAAQTPVNVNPFISGCGTCSIPANAYNHKMQ